MKVAWLLAVSVAVLSPAQVRLPPPGSAPAPPAVFVGSGGISGVVRDEAGARLRRATVSVSGAGVTRSTVTDDDGRFSFVELPEGRFTLTASKPAYPATSYGARRPNRPGPGIVLGAGQQVNDLTMVLARGGVLSGVVFDERGQPMPAVPVMAWEVRSSLAGERTLEFPATGGVSVMSDDRGAYRIYGLPPGEYTVGTSWSFRGSATRVPTDAEIRAAFAPTQSTASSQSTAPAASRQEVRTFSYTPVFMPTAVDPLAAATVTLGVGEERSDLNLHMQLVAMSKIEGEVVDETGRLPGVTFQLSRNSAVQALNVTSMYPGLRDGTFSSDSLTPGTYALLARGSARDGSGALWAREDVTVTGSDTRRVTLRLKPALTLTGQFIAQGSSGAPPPDLSSGRLTLLPLVAPFQSVGTATVQSSGALTVIGVMPGRYRLGAAVSGPTGQQWMLQSIVAGERDVTDLPFEVPDGSVPPLTVTFTDRVSELSGTLTDATGRPAPGYFVIVASATREYWLPGSRRIVSGLPDVNGRFVFRALPPGDYRVAVTTDLVQSDLADRNALVEMMNQSTPVTIGVGEKKVFDIRLGDR